MSEETVILDFSKPNEYVPHSPIGTMVKEYDLEGNFIKNWNSVSQVANAFGTSYSKIRGVMNGRFLQANGRIFLKMEDNIQDRLHRIEEEKKKAELKESIEQAYKEAKEIRVYTSSGKYLRTCSNIKEAAQIYSIPAPIICNHFNNKSCVTNGLVFLNSSQSIEDRLKRIKNRKTHKKNL